MDGLELMYDEDLPGIEMSWADLLKENKAALITASKIVAIPTSLFVLTCIANYFINKKVKSL